MKIKIGAMWMTVAIAGAGGQVQAHHSYGMFDRATEKTLVGTVEAFEWTNPHAWVRLAVPDGSGGVVTWRAEIGPPGQLSRTGWRRTTLKPGDKVQLTLNPLKDGTPGGHLMQVKAADGKWYYDSVFGKKQPDDSSSTPPAGSVNPSH